MKATNVKNTKKRSVLICFIVLAVILLLLTFISVNIFGKSCSLEFNVSSPDKVNIVYDENIVECISRQSDGNTLTLDFTAVSKGDTFVEVYDDSNTASQVRLFVHQSKIITIDNFFGRCRGDIMFSVSAVRTCPHRVNVRIIRHNFVGDKAKIRRRAVALQGFLTQSPAKFDEKTCMNPYVDRFLFL
ncbi:MAG: hypothetical protein KBA55_13525 [Ruminococcus sp.]|nr:hypothetical protein [Ruminococcus sp.]